MCYPWLMEGSTNSMITDTVVTDALCTTIKFSDLF